jgi:protocatechuate 3,4-dioxygenase beta subunit
MRAPRLSRRSMLRSTAATAGYGLLAACPPHAWGGRLPATPECSGAHEATLPSVEGPYFEPNSPERADLVEPDSPGHMVLLEGRVLSRSCAPIARVLLDLWHADQDGLYDRHGYRYRGHVYSDADGRYRFRTIEPAVYLGRTRHFHFKVQAPARTLLTTQLFFPGEPRNTIDRLFRPELLLSVDDSPGLMQARFDFVLNG